MPPSDSNGNYSLPASYHVENGDTVLPVQHNIPFEDIANGLTNRLMKDGRTVMTGDLKMGANRITDLANGQNPGDALTVDQLYGGSGRALIYPDTGPEVYDAGGRQITGLADGSEPDDAATVRQARGLRPTYITMPDDFDWPANAGQNFGKFPLSVIRKPDGSYDGGYVSPYPPTVIGQSTGTKRYISDSSGSNSNDGLTPQAALQTIDNADTRTGVVEIDLAPGNHLNSWTIALTRTQLFMGCRGKARLVTGFIPSSWTSVGSGIYSAAASSSPAIVTVVNDRQSDEFGFPLALPRYADLAALQAASGPGFAHVSSTLYIRLAAPKPSYPFVSGGFAVPQSNDVVVLTRGSSIPRLNAGSRYYFQNIEFWGGDFAFQLNGPDGATTSSAHVAFDNCDFAFAYADGVSIWNGSGGAWFKDCRAFRNGRDGFNYHDTDPANPTLAIEDHCISLGNGFNGTTDTHQGSTNHDNGRVIRIGGMYGAGLGGDVVDIDNSQSWNVGCAAIGSRAVSGISNNGWETQNAAQMWLDDCSSYDSVNALMARGTSEILTRNFAYDGLLTEDGGTIGSY